MRVIVVGAGEVGTSIAGNLADAHEVVVIDVDPGRVEELTYNVDVLALEGDGTTLETLREAGIERADMVIASTDEDETNLAICGTAKTVTDAFTIARVQDTKYLDTWESDEERGAFGVDFMVCTNLLTAETIARVIGLPATQDVDEFADGRVLMAQFHVGADSPVSDQTVREADRFDSLTFAAVLRDDDAVIPRGDTRIRSGDDVVVIGSPESVRSFATEVAPAVEGRAGDVVVFGGGEVGFLVAQLLEVRGFSPRLIEQDPDRARHVAEELPGTTVMESDATDREFLDRENVGEADVVVAALESDEKNLLVSLLAKELGAERAVAVVNTPEYVALFEAVTVDVAVNPRKATAEEITRFTRDRRAENVALIESDRAEVIEVEIEADSALAGRTIREGVRDLPDGVVVGAITRGEEFITPRGNTVVEVGDHVVLFVDATVVEEVTRGL